MPGPCAVFIGLHKIVDRARSIDVCPVVTNTIAEEEVFLTAFECVSSLPHFEGCYHPSLPFASLFGFASWAVKLSSTPSLALSTLSYYLEVFIACAGYPSCILLRLSKKWDAANPLSLVSCVRAVTIAVARHSAKVLL